jgi:protein SCO1/2
MLPYYDEASFTPLWKNEKAFSADTIHVIDDFKFIDQNGNSVTNETFAGKVYVANFFFTICPGICPKMTANLQTIIDEFPGEKDLLFISHSVTPHIDSVAQLRKYASENKIDATRWRLVTGDKDDIYDLARKSYFAEQEIGFQNASSNFLHTEHFILVDRQGHIRGIYKGTLELETERLKEDISILLNE